MSRPFCAAFLVAALLIGGVAGYGVARWRGQQVAFAQTTVSCSGGGSFVISTGTSGGKCSVVTDRNGNVQNGYCADGSNTARANCWSNGGRGACGDSYGAGSCLPGAK